MTSKSSLSTTAQILYLWDDRRKQWVLRGEMIRGNGVPWWVASAVAETTLALDREQLALAVRAAAIELESRLPF